MGNLRGLWLAGLCLVIALPAYAGVKVTEADGTVTYVADGRLMSEPKDPQEVVHVFDANSGRMTMINRSEHTYAEGSVDDYCSAINQMQKEAQANMTPEQRQMMQQLMGQMAGKARQHKVKVKDQGSGGRILGYPTRHYTVYVDGKPHEDVWLTDDRGLLSSAGDYHKLMRMTTRLSSCITSSMGGMAAAPVEASDAYRKLMEKGWELRSVTHAAGMKQTHQVKAIKQGDIPASRFQPPAGYRKVPLGSMMKSGYGAK